MNHPGQQWTQPPNATHPPSVTRGFACCRGESVAWFAVAMVILYGLVVSGTAVDNVFSLLAWGFAAGGLVLSVSLFWLASLAWRGGRRPHFAVSVVTWLGVVMNAVVGAFCLIRLPYSSRDGDFWIAILIVLLVGAAISAVLGFTGYLLLNTKDSRHWFSRAS